MRAAWARSRDGTRPRAEPPTTHCRPTLGVPTYFIHMKAIQISFDEELLKRLDKDEEVKKDGRSAVFRRAVALYLRQKRRKRIAEAYGQAYAKGTPAELVGWADEGTWPEP